MSDRIPTKHDMDIVDALDLMYQHYMDQTDTDDQAAADFERNEAITIKRAMNEIASLRARLERARELPKKWRDEAWESVPPEYADRDLHYKYFRCDNNAGGLVDAADDLEEALRELETSGGGDGS